jgi:hypothetical protein
VIIIDGYESWSSHECTLFVGRSLWPKEWGTSAHFMEFDYHMYMNVIKNYIVVVGVCSRCSAVVATLIRQTQKNPMNALKLYNFRTVDLVPGEEGLM